MFNNKTMNIKNIISNIKITIIAFVKTKNQVQNNVNNSLFVMTLSEYLLVCIRTPYERYRGRAY
ncbi:hypothetical protein SAMN02745111_01224 [Eubacterium uniforme]|uniref:Uncharacterized protein n=1 Tax=Eubacterium uniforme TaxID=39495 RepID=A0A1T4VMF2_9FIRM|nr:hypothetical protein SAMN02745111_01224 [Eubacterium uniforme]